MDKHIYDHDQYLLLGDLISKKITGKMWGTASLVASVAGFLIVPIIPLFSIIGIVLGLIALFKKSYILGIIGIVLGILGIVLLYTVGGICALTEMIGLTKS